MSEEFDPKYIPAIAIFALFTGAAVVIAGNHYETPLKLPFKILMVSGPTFVPLALLSRHGAGFRACRVALALLISTSWLWVIYEDVRPYVGGGASFAVLVGWTACLVAGILATIILTIDHLRHRTRRSIG